MCRSALVAVLVVAAVATAQATGLRSYDEIQASRRTSWAQGERVDGTRRIEWRVELTQPEAGLKWLDETFWAVSTPSDPR